MHVANANNAGNRFRATSVSIYASAIFLRFDLCPYNAHWSSQSLAAGRLRSLLSVEDS